MKRHYETRAVVGILVWIGLISAGILMGRQSLSGRPEVVAQLAQYMGEQRHAVTLESDYRLVLRRGDPVFLAGSESIAPVGSISSVELDRDGYAAEATVSLFGSAPRLKDTDYFEYHYSPNSAAWVLKTMLTNEKRNEISDIIMASYRKNQEDVVKALRPIIEASFQDAANVIRTDFKLAIESRDDQLKSIGVRFQNELIEKEIVPLIQSEVWPIIREQSAPLANEVGQKIWNEVSVFRFGWRYVYDQTPFTNRNLTEAEFDRFVNQKVVPVLEAHMNDFISLQKRLIRQIITNKEVIATVSQSLKTVAQDKEVQALLTDVFREVLVDNVRLREVLEDRWKTPEAQAAIALANRRIEPTITEIGVSLFGSPDGAITPEFANVLRRRILNKDSRWITLHSAVERSPLEASSAALWPTQLPIRLSESDDPIPSARARDRR